MHVTTAKMRKLPKRSPFHEVRRSSHDWTKWNQFWSFKSNYENILIKKKIQIAIFIILCWIPIIKFKSITQCRILYFIVSYNLIKNSSERAVRWFENPPLGPSSTDGPSPNCQVSQKGIPMGLLSFIYSQFKIKKTIKKQLKSY